MGFPKVSGQDFVFCFIDIESLYRVWKLYVVKRKLFFLRHNGRRLIEIRLYSNKNTMLIWGQISWNAYVNQIGCFEYLTILM